MTREEIEKIAWNYIVEQANGYFDDDDEIQYAYLVTEKVVDLCMLWPEDILDVKEITNHVDSCYAWYTVQDGRLVLLPFREGIWD